MRTECTTTPELRSRLARVINGWRGHRYYRQTWQPLHEIRNAQTFVPKGSTIEGLQSLYDERYFQRVLQEDILDRIRRAPTLDAAIESAKRIHSGGGSLEYRWNQKGLKRRFTMWHYIPVDVTIDIGELIRSLWWMKSGVDETGQRDIFADTNGDDDE